MVGERGNPDEMPEYVFEFAKLTPFTIWLGSINYFDYISIDELSILDIDDIAIKLNYKLHVGYWIQFPRYGKPYQILRDEELMWFEDKILENRVIYFYLECIQPLQTFRGDELIPSQQLESQNLLYSDDEDNRAAADSEDNGVAADTKVNRAAATACYGDRPVNEKGDEEMTEEDAERAKSQRKNKGKYIAEEEEEAEEVEEEAETDKGDDLVESDLIVLDISYLYALTCFLN
ncbi:hypothetical protein Q3G72_009576 [Acer saccharum]|nr:hypothetical protein Q3G72_020203 [Acer saccharum]KAK1570954.1 hypothetical protein Q3G72_009576 [Acer saccharum]